MRKFFQHGVKDVNHQLRNCVAEEFESQHIIEGGGE